MRVSVKATNNISRNIENMLARVVDSLPAIAGNAANIIAEEAQLRAPIDTGELRRSTFVYPSEATEASAAAVVGLGGPRIHYAVLQHEFFPVKRRAGEWKYLENAIHARLSDVIVEINAQAAKAITGFKPTFVQRFRTGPT